MYFTLNLKGMRLPLLHDLLPSSPREDSPLHYEKPRGSWRRLPGSGLGSCLLDRLEGEDIRREGKQRKFPWESCLVSAELIRKLTRFYRMF